MKEIKILTGKTYFELETKVNEILKKSKDWKLLDAVKVDCGGVSSVTLYRE